MLTAVVCVCVCAHVCVCVWGFAYLLFFSKHLGTDGKKRAGEGGKEVVLEL